MDLADIQADQYNFSNRKFSGQMNLPHMTYGFVGEIGEFYNKVKKIDRGDLKLTPEVLQDLGWELADVLIYLVDIASVLHINLDAAYLEVANRNEERFPDAGSSNQPDLFSEVLQRQQDTHGAGAFVPEESVQRFLQER